ncbi:hypothetical protein ACOMHN_026551 [Nucella lapillus]
MSDLLSTPQDLSQNMNCLDYKTSSPSSLWPGPENGKNFASAYLQHGTTHTLWLIIPPVLLAMGCFGNGMTIVVMRRMRASESTACLSVYFTALAVSDLFVLCTTVIWYWPEMAFDTPVSYFHDLSCTIPYFVSGTSSMTSSWVLMAMTSQRLTSVVVPLRVGVLCTVSRGKIITGSILIFACVTKMHVFFNNHVVVVDEEYKVCASIDEDVAYVHRMVDLFLVSVRHPSLWTYIWHLKDQQARAEQQMTAAANGEAPPSRRRKWRQLEQRIVRLKNQFINGNRNLEEYWSAVAHCICHFQ